MSSFQSRIWSQQQLAYVPHTSVSGDTWQCVRSGLTTGAGSTTTVVDAGIGGANDDYNGRYWVEVTSGSAIGQWKRVVDYVATSGTLTVEATGFTVAPGSGVYYRLWLSPEPVVVVDSTTATTIVDAIRAEADDFWNGYYLVPINGTDRGVAPVVITDFANATGTFTVANNALDGVAAGDVLLIRQFIEADGISPGLTENYLPTHGNRVNFSKGDGVRGMKGGTIAFNTYIRPGATAPTDETPAGLSNVGGLFQAVGLEEVDDTTQLVNDVAATTTSIDVDDGSKFTVGQMVGFDGDYTFITTISTNTLTVSPALPARGGAVTGPADDTIVQACRGYVQSTDGDGMYGVCIELANDGVRTTMTGCKGNVDLTDAEAPLLNWNLQVDHYVRDMEAAPYTATDAYDTTAPVLSQNRKAYVGATATNVAAVTATPGAQMAPRNIQGAAGVNGRSGFQVTDYRAGLTWRELMDSSITTNPQEVRWLARSSNAISVVWYTGSDAFGVRIPAARHIESVIPQDDGGMQSVMCVFGAQDAGMDTTDATVKVPDFGFFIT